MGDMLWKDQKQKHESERTAGREGREMSEGQGGSANALSRVSEVGLGNAQYVHVTEMHGASEQN